MSVRPVAIQILTPCGTPIIAKMRRERFGQSSERGAHLIEQLELELPGRS